MSGVTARAGAIAPGLALAVAVMLAAGPLAAWLGGRLLAARGVDAAGATGPVSAVSVAILLGLVVGNLVALPPVFAPGLRFAVARALRLGIVLIGVKLSLADVLRLGLGGLPVAAGAVVTGLLFVRWLAARAGLTPALGALLAAGTGVCGVSAVVATAPAVRAEEREVAVAIAAVALFGLLGMLGYPYLAPLLLPRPEAVGLFLGTAIHDTSQVVGAALAYRQVHGAEAAFEVATVTKLTRNLSLALVVPLLAWAGARRAGAAVAGRRPPMVPAFVLGFVAMAALRSLGDAGLAGGRALGALDADLWRAWTTVLGEVWGARILLGTAMAAVGLNTRVAEFRGLGPRPFAVGFAGALAVGLAGLALARLLGPHVRL